MRRPQAAVGSALFLVVGPGAFTVAVPWWLTGWHAHDTFWLWRIVGAVLIATGVPVLLQAYWRFVWEGLGTPAPIAPPGRLVVGGIYRFVRNPIYLALIVTVVGEALVLGRPILLLEAALFAVAVVAFVRLYEEPTLLRQFGSEYEAYRRAVPGWWPRLRR
jgi:protein-S-isoprenylcysteine O-methyltransferase Ste14